MARSGVTQQDISEAADALVAAGERPTVERVRLALGRGSPNTIGPLLEGWWAQLAQRLTQRLSLPGLPDAVGEAFAHAWAVALDAGRAHAETQVAPERAALADVLAKAAALAAAHQARVEALEHQLLQAQTALRGAEAAWALSEQRVADLQREVATLTASAAEHGRQREAAEARLLAARVQIDNERAAAATERDALQAHQRQVEDRAYGEVDRLRQETKALKQQLAAQTREQAAARRAGAQALRAAESAMHAAQRESAALQARVQVLSASASAAKPAGRRSPARKPAAPKKRAAAQ